MMMTSVCVGQKKQRSMCFLNVNAMSHGEEKMVEDMGCAGREGKNN